MQTTHERSANEHPTDDRPVERSLPEGVEHPPEQTSPYAHTVVVLVDDLFFATRIEDVVRRLGGRPLSVSTPGAFARAVEASCPVLALLDMKTPGDWEGAIRRCKLLPHTRQTPIYAFGSHVDVDAFRRARLAGADHAWARSRMMQELVQVIEGHLRPGAQPVAGCEDPLPQEAVAGFLALNQGRYFEQHEHLEAAWIAEPRPVRALYQGVLQVGLALLQLEQGNWRGAVKMLGRGLPKLRSLPDRCQGVDVAEFRQAAEALHAELSRQGPRPLHPPEHFPPINFVNPFEDNSG